MTGYLLDTNVLSHLVRNPRGRVRDHIAKVGESAVWTSVIVAGELRFGAIKSGSPRLRQSVEAVLDTITVNPIRPPADNEYARLRQTLEAFGHPIGPNDMLVAAHALTENATLVTANTREFRRVPGLAVSDWVT